MRTLVAIVLLTACGSAVGPAPVDLLADAAADQSVFADAAAPAVADLGVTAVDQAIVAVDQAIVAVDQASAAVDQASVVVDAAAVPVDLGAARPVDLPPPPALVFHAIGEVIDASPDETDNLWAVASDALHILQAGQTQWRRYTNADGLHIWSVVTAVAGGGANEGWVGLQGFESDFPDLDPPDLKRVGKAEHVRLASDGSITSLHYAELHNDNGDHWHTRSARRLLYVHGGANAGHLFLGANHGVTNIFNDTWGDHIHAEVFYQPENSLVVGQWYGLAIDPATGGLWTCGYWSCGLQRFYADNRAWVNGVYQWAFTVFTGNHDLDVPHGYTEKHVGVAVTPGGRAWFLSSANGLASWDPATANYTTIQRHAVPGLGLPVDVVADPDGTLWLADTTHVLRWDPATNVTQPLPLPSSDVRRLYMDTTRTPRALYVSTGGGLAIYRGP